MIVINDRNKQKITEQFGTEISGCFNEIEAESSKISTGENISLEFFEIYAHDKLRNIQFYEIPNGLQSCHVHNCYEFTYVTDGAIIMSINGQSYILEKGDVLIISPDTYHCSKNIGKSKVFKVLIKKDWFEKMADIFEKYEHSNFISTLCQNNIYTIFNNQNNHEFKKNIKEFESIERTVYRSTDLYDNCYFENIFIKCMINLTRSKRMEFSCNSERNYNVSAADQICRYIRDNCNRVSIGDVAKHFGFSRTHIYRILKSYSDQSYTSIIAYERLRRAKLLLLNTRMPIYEIASELGFKSADSFLRFFKKYRGITPSEYRSYKVSVGKFRTRNQNV